MSEVKASALGLQAAVIDGAELHAASAWLRITFPGPTAMRCLVTKTGTTLFMRKQDMASGGEMVAEEGRRGGGDGRVMFSPPGAQNDAASAGIGQVSASPLLC